MSSNGVIVPGQLAIDIEWLDIPGGIVGGSLLAIGNNRFKLVGGIPTRLMVAAQIMNGGLVPAGPALLMADTLIAEETRQREHGILAVSPSP